LKHAGSLDDLGYRLFLAIGHDVDTADAGNFADFLYQLDADIAPFARLIGSALEARDRTVRDVHPGHVLAHPLRRLGRAQRSDAREDEYLSEQPHILRVRHERAQQGQVVAILGLDELCAGGDLLRQSLRAPFVRQAGRIFGGSQKHARRIRDLAAALKPVLVAQVACDVEQRYAVQIEHRLRLRMIARLYAIAGQTQDVADPHRRTARTSP